MLRRRWLILIFAGALFFCGFAMWLNEAPMSDNHPANDSFFPLFVFLWVMFGIPYYVTPFLMKLKSPNIDGIGVSTCVSTQTPLIRIPPVIAREKDGSIVVDENEQPVYIYPEYHVYNLGSADAFNLKMKGGHWEGIAVFPKECCFDNGVSVRIACADIEVMVTPEEKARLPEHVLDHIVHEYKYNKKWLWNDTYPIWWGEIPMTEESVPKATFDLEQRCKALEAETKTWKAIARKYETKALAGNRGQTIHVVQSANEAQDEEESKGGGLFGRR